MLYHEGYIGANIVGCDLHQGFLDLGRKLYQDTTTCLIHFLAYDVFDMPISATPHTLYRSDLPISKVAKLSELANRITHLHAGMLFHLFDEPTQYALALRICSLLKREPGVIAFGWQQAATQEQLIVGNLWKYVRFRPAPFVICKLTRIQE